MPAAKSVRFRVRAVEDVERATDYLLAEAGSDTARQFVDAVGRQVASLARRPRHGSPRLAVELDLPGLRTWPVKSFPYVIFYVEQESEISVWRVLHTRRDLRSTWNQPDAVDE
jgi:toxin ParE1/3/4